MIIKTVSKVFLLMYLIFKSINPKQKLNKSIKDKNNVDGRRP